MFAEERTESLSILDTAGNMFTRSNRHKHLKILLQTRCVLKSFIADTFLIITYTATSKVHTKSYNNTVRYTHLGCGSVVILHHPCPAGWILLFSTETEHVMLSKALNQEHRRCLTQSLSKYRLFEACMISGPTPTRTAGCSYGDKAFVELWPLRCLEFSAQLDTCEGRNDPEERPRKVLQGWERLLTTQ